MDNTTRFDYIEKHNVYLTLPTINIVIINNLEKVKIMAKTHMVALSDLSITISMIKVERGLKINTREKEQVRAKT